jgi:hypothetical protein
MDLRQLHLREPDPREADPRLDPGDLDPRDLASDRRAQEPPLHPSELNRFENEPGSVSRRVPVAFVRFVIFFFMGVATTLAWQSYGNAARGTVAHLTAGLGWLAPPAAPPSAPGSSAAVPTVGASPDQLAAVSRSLAAVRQSVDRLAADVTKLQAARQDPAPVRASGAPAAAPPATTAQGRKPAAVAQPAR